jgi:uncharacterized protein with GYD domain
MATYIVLINWTDQGVKTFKDTVDRYEAAREAGTRLGTTWKDVYWTVGPYDIVTLVDSPDDETMTAALLALGAAGNIRTTTMRGFSIDEMRRVVDKATS